MQRTWPHRSDRTRTRPRLSPCRATVSPLAKAKPPWSAAAPGDHRELRPVVAAERDALEACSRDQRPRHLGDLPAPGEGAHFRVN
jgi:hypothetical protein